MSHETDDWAALQAAWRSRPEPEDTAADYRARAQRERRRAAIEAVVEVMVSLTCAGVFLAWARDLAGVERWALIGLAVSSVGAIPVSLALRRGMWRASADTLAGHAAFLRRRAARGLWFARLGYVGAPVGVGIGAVMATLGEFGARDGGVGPAMLAVAIAALAGFVVWSVREAARFRRMLAAMEAEDAA